MKFIYVTAFGPTVSRIPGGNPEESENRNQGVCGIMKKALCIFWFFCVFTVPALLIVLEGTVLLFIVLKLTALAGAAGLGAFYLRWVLMVWSKKTSVLFVLISQAVLIGIAVIACLDFPFSLVWKTHAGLSIVIVLIVGSFTLENAK